MWIELEKMGVIEFTEGCVFTNSFDARPFEKKVEKYEFVKVEDKVENGLMRFEEKVE
jgi:hypothetical protein